MGGTLTGAGWVMDEIVGGSPRLLARSAVAVPYTGTLNETALAAISIPAGIMGLNGGIYFRVRLSRTNNANAHTQRVRWGGLSGSLAAITAAASVSAIQLEGEIRNRGSAASQLVGASGAGFVATATSAWVTDTKDTAAAVDLVFSTQLATSSADTVTLESYEVWLLP